RVFTAPAPAVDDPPGQGGFAAVGTGDHAHVLLRRPVGVGIGVPRPEPLGAGGAKAVAEHGAAAAVAGPVVVLAHRPEHLPHHRLPVASPGPAAGRAPPLPGAGRLDPHAAPGADPDHQDVLVLGDFGRPARLRAILVGLPALRKPRAAGGAGHNPEARPDLADDLLSGQHG